jgi:hypothetical protein
MAHLIRVAADSGNGGVLERSRAPYLIAAAALAALVTALAWWMFRGRPGPGVQPAIPGDGGPAITAEVLNGTDVGGLAREATRRLRSRGIDVVYFGSSPDRHDLDTTIILIRRGDTTAGVTVRRVLGTGRVKVELDPNRLLDVSVVVGRDLATLDRHP